MKFLDSTGLLVLLKNLRVIFNEKAMFSSYNGEDGIVLYNKVDNNISYSYVYSNSYVDTMINSITTSYNNLQTQYNNLLKRVELLESTINNTNDISNSYLGDELQTIATVNGINITAGVHDIKTGVKNTADAGEIETVYGILNSAGFNLDD